MRALSYARMIICCACVPSPCKSTMKPPPSHVPTCPQVYFLATERRAHNCTITQYSPHQKELHLTPFAAPHTSALSDPPSSSTFPHLRCMHACMSCDPTGRSSHLARPDPNLTKSPSCLEDCSLSQLPWVRRVRIWNRRQASSNSTC